jgi:hypothetical protein
VSALNATRYGLRAQSPVVPGLERAEDWRRHHAGIVASLAPVGFMECALTDRIALFLWRMRRIGRYERCALGDIYESAPEVVRQRRIAAWRPGLPTTIDEADEALRRYKEITSHILALDSAKPAATLPGHVVYAVACHLADTVGASSEGITLQLSDGRTVVLDDLQDDDESYPIAALLAITDHVGVGMGREILLAAAVDLAEERESEARLERGRLTDEIAAEQRRAMLDETVLDRVARYETTWERSFERALHELQRLQAARNGGITAPLAVDFAS